MSSCIGWEGSACCRSRMRCVLMIQFISPEVPDHSAPRHRWEANMALPLPCSDPTASSSPNCRQFSPQGVTLGLNFLHFPLMGMSLILVLFTNPPDPRRPGVICWSVVHLPGIHSLGPGPLISPRLGLGLLRVGTSLILQSLLAPGSPACTVLPPVDNSCIVSCWRS